MKTFKIQDGDIVFSSATGRPVTVEGKLKFDQDVQENIFLDRQPNGTGSGLNAAIGKTSDPFSLTSEIQTRVINSFNALRRIQESVLRFSRQRSEMIDSVINVVVTPFRNSGTNRFDPTRYNVKIQVSAKDKTVSNSAADIGQ